MSAPFLVPALIGACASVAYGITVIPSRARILREASKPNPLAEAQVIALAKAEIAASKRGDLLAAAELAEAQERVA